MSLEKVIEKGLADIASAIRELKQQPWVINANEPVEEKAEKATEAVKEALGSVAEAVDKESVAEDTKAAPSGEENKKPETSKITIEQVLSTFNVFVAKKGRDRAVTLMSEYGVDRSKNQNIKNDLSSDNYSAFMESMALAMEE